MVEREGLGGQAPAWSTREIERRHRAEAGRPLNPVMKAAATACELAHGAAALRASGPALFEAPVPAVPRGRRRG